MKLLSGVLLLSFVGAAAAAPEGAARGLSFEDRVRAQEVLERARYKHQLGVTTPFAAAVPRAALEAKVRTYLEQTAALQVYWKTTVTDFALEREVVRMVAGTRMPERLQELFDALGNDPFLIKECLARPALVDRLTRSFYALDAKADPATARLPLRDRPVLAVASGGGVSRTAIDPARGLRSTSGCFADSWDNRSLDDGPEPLPRPYSVWTGTEMLVWGGFSSTGFRYDPAIDHWTGMSSVGAPSPRYATSVVWTGSAMVVWGGMSTDEPYPGLDTGGRYDPMTDSWQPTSTTGAPSARRSHTAVWTGASMIIWGGGSNTGGRYDPVGDAWQPTSSVGAPSSRSGHAAVWTGSSMIVWGGGDNTGGLYDPIANAWAPMSTAGAPSPYVPAAIWTGSRMVVWNGNEGGRYDPAADSWLPVSGTNAPSGRRDQSIVWTGSRMIVWGGGSPSGPQFNQGSGYDPVADQWAPTSSMGAPTAREGHTAVWTGQLMLVWGGITYTSATGFSNYLSTGGRYDPATDSWTPTATGPPGAPSPRSGHTAVWTGIQMLVWGGDATEPRGVSPLGTGSRYDPATDSWTPMATANAPTPRIDHTAVWTGSTMIVWGGRSFDVMAGTDRPVKTGGRYDPIADTWIPTSMVGAPGVRHSHTAVWTGTKLLVWGGLGDAGNGNHPPLSTGGRYDPMTNAWEPIATTGAPSERWDHSAVWTGSRMVIWGGGWLGDAGGSGGRYDPATDTWEPTSETGAPVARSGHTASWTGARMLIWGGEAESNPFDGGAYDPALDEWQPMSRTGQPAALGRGSALWTGSELLVWGGSTHQSVTGYLNDVDKGGRYDPATNTWRGTTTVGAPSSRLDHSAVWTGSRMIVWGGARTIEKLGNGGIYRLDDVAGGECDGDGFTVASGDCNDDDPSVHPGATETCNHVDDDCDGVLDEGGGALCDDANVCTVDSCEAQGGCTLTPEPEGLDCDDHNVCNGYEACNGYGYCASSNNVYCFPDGSACTVDTCDPELGCVYVPRPAGTSCSDGDSCNGSEICDQDGWCQPGTPVAPPAEIASLVAAADKLTYSWSADPVATAYDVVRGRTDALPVGPGLSDEMCFGPFAGASMTDAGTPPAGVAYWYLARGENACAGPGTYGMRSDGAPRVTTTCP